MNKFILDSFCFILKLNNIFIYLLIYLSFQHIMQVFYFHFKTKYQNAIHYLFIKVNIF